MDEQTIDTSNDCLIAVQGDQVLVMMPRGRMDKATALRMAAWLVALSESEEGEFQRVLDAVLNT